jgi:flagellar protein FlaG
MDVSNVNSGVNFDSFQGLPKTVKNEVQKPQTQPQEHTDISKEKLDTIVSELNKEIKPISTDLSFGYSSDIDQLIVEVKNNLTGEVIRTLPSKEALNLAKKMKELVGLIFDKTA